MAQVLAIFGGLLILVEAVGFATFLLEGTFAFGVVAGLGIVAAGAALGRRPRYRRELGIAILFLSMLSFLGVSGFLLGALLGMVGGILAITSRGRPYLNPMSSLYGAPSLGAPCPNCGKPVPPWTTKCPYCASP